MWVLPILTISLNSSYFAARASLRARSFGSNRSLVSITAAMWMTEGKVSLEDYDRLTSSFGWMSFDPTAPPISSAPLLLITSLAFMFDWVPDPVYQTTRGK